MQGCNIISLSPLFYNSKYSNNKILNPLKFNLIKKNWNTDVCALGGINSKNIKKINRRYKCQKRIICNVKQKMSCYSDVRQANVLK